MISSSSLLQQLLDESVWRGEMRRHTALQPLHPEHHMFRRMQTCCYSMTQGAVFWRHELISCLNKPLTSTTHVAFQTTVTNRAVKLKRRGGGVLGAVSCIINMTGRTARWVVCVTVICPCQIPETWRKTSASPIGSESRWKMKVLCENQNCPSKCVACGLLHSHLLKTQMLFCFSNVLFSVAKEKGQRSLAWQSDGQKKSLPGFPGGGHCKAKQLLASDHLSNEWLLKWLKTLCLCSNQTFE